MSSPAMKSLANLLAKSPSRSGSKIVSASDALRASLLYYQIEYEDASGPHTDRGSIIRQTGAEITFTATGAGAVYTITVPTEVIWSAKITKRHPFLVRIGEVLTASTPKVIDVHDPPAPEEVSGSDSDGSSTFDRELSVPCACRESPDSKSPHNMFSPPDPKHPVAPSSSPPSYHYCTTHKWLHVPAGPVPTRIDERRVIDVPFKPGAHSWTVSPSSPDHADVLATERLGDLRRQEARNRRRAGGHVAGQQPITGGSRGPRRQQELSDDEWEDDEKEKRRQAYMAARQRDRQTLLLHQRQAFLAQQAQQGEQDAGSDITGCFLDSDDDTEGGSFITNSSMAVAPGETPLQIGRTTIRPPSTESGITKSRSTVVGPATVRFAEPVVAGLSKSGAKSVASEALSPCPSMSDSEPEEDPVVNNMAWTMGELGVYGSVTEDERNIRSA